MSHWCRELRRWLVRSYGDRLVGPRCALNGPGVGRRLAVLQDLLDHDVGLRGDLPQPLEVAERVAQAVDVVDPQAGDAAGLDELGQQAVALAEHRLEIGRAHV